MRRSSSSLSALFATGVLALAPTAQAQLFRRPAAPAPPPAQADDPGARPSYTGRSAQHDLRNGLDYLDKYGDAPRALHYLTEARRRQAELTTAERKQLAAAWARAERVIAGSEEPNTPIARLSTTTQSTRLDPKRMPTLPPDTPVLANAARPTPANPTGDPSVQVTAASAPAPAPAPPPAPAMLLTLESVPNTTLDEPPALEADPSSVDVTPEPVQEPAPVSQPIGLTVISDPNDYLAPLAEPMPAPAPAVVDEPAQSPAPIPLETDPAPAVIPTEDAAPAAVSAIETDPAPAVIPTEDAAPAGTAKPRDTGILLIPPPPAQREQILPTLPGASELPELAPEASQPEPVVETIPFQVETLEAEAPAPAPAPAPVYEPTQTDGGILLIPPPPAQAAAASLPLLPGDEPQPQPEPVALDDPAMNTPPPALPRPAVPVEAVASLPDLPPQDDPTNTLPPAPAADELPGLPASSAAPFVPPRPISPSSTPRVRIDREETRRDVEELSRRMEENIERSPISYPPPNQTDDRGPGRTDEAGTTALVPRAPTPSEARPIRPIPVPEAFVPFEQREFEPYRKYFAASGTCYMPLYFQDAALERYGQSAEQALGPHWGRYFSYPLDDPRQSTQRNQILQPFYSAGLFALQIAALPYHMVMDPPWEAQYDLGYHRPGDPVPPDTIYWPKHGIGPPLQGRKY